MWLSGSVARPGGRSVPRKVQHSRLNLSKRYLRRYRRRNETVLILVLFLLLIVVLFYFS